MLAFTVFEGQTTYMSGRDYRSLDELAAARQEVAETCRLMHRQGYIAASDGNVSVRIGDTHMLITPSGIRKGFLNPDDVVLCDLKGQPAAKDSRAPSSEMGMHLAIYQSCADVRGIVHAHPPCALAHTVVGLSVAEPLMPEVYCELGEVPMVPYTVPGSRELPEAVAKAALGKVAVMMERHGSVTLGRTLSKAYDRLEVLEHGAKVSLMSRVLVGSQGISGLSSAQMAPLVMARL